MNYLPKTSEWKNRYQKVQQDIAAYWMDQVADYVRGRYDEKATITGLIVAVLRDPKLERELLIPGLNIVTNDGDEYYAQSAAGETPSNDFAAAAAGWRLGTGVAAPNKGSTDVTIEDPAGRKATDATYPRTNDPDGDNTGSGNDIVTWRVSYTTAEAIITGISEGAICEDRVTPTAALTHFLFPAPFDKTGSDTLKVFANHEMLGV